MILAKPTFLTIGLAILLCPGNGFAEPAQPFTQDTGIVGPLVGAVDAHSAQLLFRHNALVQTLRLDVFDESDKIVRTVEATTEAASDYVAKFHVDQLQPETRYRYRITRVDDTDETGLAVNENLFFRTLGDWSLPSNRTKFTATACFVSCVDIEENPLWKGIANVSPDVICLMGDTPYIDSSDLNIVRQRQREFLRIPVLSDLIHHTPTLGTWDDHDFGRNNGNGRNMADGKTSTRQGFVEYRAHAQYGTGTEGVYHKIDLGMLEIFLLDPRYFSQTGPSPIDPKQPTCFGAEQWSWILEQLKSSEAPFKVLSMGCIWQDKKNSETDDMFTYWYERDALLDYVQQEKISGVVLLGGDIHVSRHLVHPLRVGYDLQDFVISPGHSRTITGLDVYHPSLRWSLVEGYQFLEISADGSEPDPKLTVRYRQAADTVNRELVVRLSELTAAPETGIKKDLRAHWSFDRDFSNDSPLADRIDAEPSKGTAIDTVGGRFDGASRFVEKQQQFLHVPHNPLDDNSDRHTVSLWLKPSSLPTHDSDERQFLYESTAEGIPSPASAYGLSLGLRSAAAPDQVRLQIYTHTLVPADQPELSPTARAQGGFDYDVPRRLLTNWTHVAVVADRSSRTLWINGEKARSFPLPIPGPVSEFGGIVIGGHRAGTGRNFDGWIDDVAVWARCLSETEIASLAKNSVRSLLAR